MSLKLYAMPSSCALAPHIALEWINKPYELKLLKQGQNRKPEYLQVNQKAKYQRSLSMMDVFLQRQQPF